MECPFEIVVCDYNRKPLQGIGAPLSASFTPRFNDLGTGQVTVSADDPVREFLGQRGARLVAGYRGEHLLSGRVTEPAGSLLATGEVTYQVASDHRDLLHTLAWVRPGGPIAPTSLSGSDGLGQARLAAGAAASPSGTTAGQVGYYDWAGGSAETVIKTIIRENFARFGPVLRPVTILPDQGRGGAAVGLTPDLRFPSVHEAIAPILEAAGLGLRVWQEPGSTEILLDVWEPATYGQPLTPASGIIEEGDWKMLGPTGTRVVIGGPGDGPDRALYQLIDHEREAEWHEAIEVFKDATGAKLEWPDGLDDAFKVPKYYPLRGDVPAAEKARFLAYLDAAARKALREGAPSAAVGVKLSETASFHFGGPDGVHLGDQLVIQSPAMPTPITERITSCHLELSRDGFTVSPVLGGLSLDEDDAVWRELVKLAAGFMAFSTSR